MKCSFTNDHYEYICKLIKKVHTEVSSLMIDIAREKKYYYYDMI